MVEHSRSWGSAFADVRHHLLVGAAMPGKVDGADIRFETSGEDVVLSGGRYRVKVSQHPRRTLTVMCWRTEPVENRLAGEADAVRLSTHVFKVKIRLRGFNWVLKGQAGERPPIDETPLSSAQLAAVIRMRLASLIQDDDSK